MSETSFDCWAVVEVMGHRVFAGRVTEQVIAGCGFVRVDVPDMADSPDNRPAFTKIIGTASIYAITPCTEDVARRAARQYHEAQPIHIWDPPSPRLRLACETAETDDGPDDGELF